MIEIGDNLAAVLLAAIVAAAVTAWRFAGRTDKPSEPKDQGDL